MKAVFVELPAFARFRSDYFDDQGLRVIYYWLSAGRQFWLFTLYDKDELKDLSTEEKKVLKGMLKAEIEARR